MAFYPRTILPKLENELQSKQAVVITGMRGTGKTTVLNHLFDRIESSNKALFDFENPLHRKVFEEENYDAIWNNLAQFNIRREERAYLFLDEAQHLPVISSVAKYLLDHWQVKFFLTGSSSFYLKNLFPESMANRKFVFELFPLTFDEFLTFRGVERPVAKTFSSKAREKNVISYERLIPFWKEYMEFGGFPEVVSESKHERKRALLQELFTSYFERDVKTLADFRDLSKLRDCILLLADRVGSKLDIVKLSSSLALSRETIYNYLEFLQDSYFVSLLPKHTGSVDRKVAGGKKVFLCDIGLTSVLGNISGGQQFEGAVFETIRPHHTLAFYDKEGASEIDFILDEAIGLEVKMTSSGRDIHHLGKRAAQARLQEQYIVSLEFTKQKDAIVSTDL